MLRRVAVAGSRLASSTSTPTSSLITTATTWEAFQSLTVSSFRAFSSGANSGAEGKDASKPEVVIVDAAPTSHRWESKAFRGESTVRYKNLPLSHYKLEKMCDLVRGMSAREALAQLRLSPWRKTVFVRQGINTATHVAVNEANMERSRLVVDEIYANKGVYRKTIAFRARGRANIQHKHFSHLTIKLREQPYHDYEVRIGRYGRTIEGTKRVNSLVQEFKKQKKDYELEKAKAEIAMQQAALKAQKK